MSPSILDDIFAAGECRTLGGPPQFLGVAPVHMFPNGELVVGPPVTQDVAEILERARDALWSMRTHERNLDGSPCWCPTDTEPDTHTAQCDQAWQVYSELVIGARSDV